MAAIADLVATELPYLRRFARALTGSQDAGDAYVVAMLESLVADRRIFDLNLRPKVAAFKALLQIWRLMPINTLLAPAPLIGPEASADRRIEMLSPMARQAMLLFALEDFSSAEIAIAMEISPANAAQLLSVAGHDISEQIRARVLIIEDEPLIALDIETLVCELGHVIVGIASTRSEAVTIARAEMPTLILADIQLADGSSGIDAVNDILKELSAPVIFITAYPERLLTGERAEPAFLVTKPFRTEMVKAIISQALFFDVKAHQPGAPLA
jgi:CheY-like chemotaxis protein/DNA-directed RNA polymerase specialized sigma24 family protein